MLKLKNIYKAFGDKAVLKDISFEIKNKSIIGLLGPNGAGKTTLMRTIVGFYTANSGTITWDNKKVNTKSEKHKNRVGYLPESNPLYLHLTTGEYLEFVARLKNIEKIDLVLEIADVAKKCGLLTVMGQKIETLSKGYKQRVGLAAAILGDPEIIILDEPTSGLDPNQIIEIRDLIKQLAKNKMIIISTHILPEARDICDRILIINNGEIVLNEETKSIKNLEKKFVELTS